MQYYTDTNITCVIRAIGCLQTITALPQLCNISWVSAEISAVKHNAFLPLKYFLNVEAF